MNDRLMLAVMVTNGLLSSGRLSSLTTNRIAADALLMADALLAAAGEQQSTPDHWYNVARRQVEEIDAFRARAEAAEAKVAELEAKNDRALERILDAVDHARAIGMTLSPEFIEDIIREEAAHD